MMHLARTAANEEMPRQFVELAGAYLEAAERLCQEMVAGNWPASFNRGQVCLWLAFHATELFLKGCIRHAAPGQALNSHSLGELQVLFARHFPGVRFEPPFGSEPVPADPELMAAVLKTDATLHQQLRYPADRSGSAWGGVRAFTPELFLGELKRLGTEFERISEIVFAKSGSAEDG